MKQIISITCVLILVVGLSHVSNRLWGGKPEVLESDVEIVLQEGMTVAQFGQVNGLPNPLLKKLFDLQTKQDLQKQVQSYGMAKNELANKVNGMKAIQAEHGSKNWKKL